METDPIIIRIQAIDEATQTINKISNSLRTIKFDMPELDIGKSLGKVQIQTRNVIKPLKQLADPVRDFQKQLNQMEVMPIERLDQSLGEAGLSSKQFTSFLATNNMEVIKGVGVYDKLTGAVISQGQAVKLATIQSRRFKFEWLSIMFAGMALDRVFGGLIKTQLQLWGISEGLAGMWTIVMAPIMALITPILWKIIDAFMNMSPGMQLAIGAIVLFIAGIAKILLIVGQVMLALMGFKILGFGIFASMGGAAAALSAAFWPIVIVIGAIILIIVAVWLAWKTNFMNIRDNIKNFIAGFKQMFNGIITIVKGIMNIVKGIFSGDFDLVRKGIEQIFKGIWNYISGGFKVLLNGIIIIFKAGLNLVYNLFKVVIDGVIWGVNKLIKLVNKIPGVNFKTIDFKMPSFQEGGIMPYTGVAYLHAGERIIPKGESGTIIFSPTINLNAEVSSDYDVRRLASQLNQYWAADFQRAVKGRV